MFIYSLNRWILKIFNGSIILLPLGGLNETFISRKKKKNVAKFINKNVNFLN